MQKIFVCFSMPDTATAARMADTAGSRHWLYFGKDYGKMRNAGQGLSGRLERIDISRRLDAASDNLRIVHVKWIDELNVHNGHDPAWWFGRVSSRNVYESDLFLYSCYLSVLKDILKSGEPVPAVILLDSPGLAEAIRKWGAKNGIDIIVENSGLIRLKKYVTAWTVLIKTLIRLASRWLNARITGRFFARSMPSDDVILLGTYLHADSIDAEGVFKDRYFPHLHEYCSKIGKKIVIVPVLSSGFSVNYWGIFKKIRKNNASFLLHEDYLYFSDYLALLSDMFFYFAGDICAPEFMDFDLLPVINEEKLLCNLQMQALLIYRSWARMAGPDVRPERILLWFENQVIDKAAVFGARKAFPGVCIKGAQLFIPSENFLNIYLSPGEIQHGLAPDILLEPGSRQCETSRAFGGNIKCEMVPALRYSHLY